MRKESKIIKISKLIIFGLFLSLFADNIFAARGSMQTTEINGVKVDYYVPAALVPELSVDGKSLLSGVPTVVYIADPASASEVQVESSNSIQSTEPSDNIVTDESFFSVDYILDGGSDKWGEPCFNFPVEAKAAFDAAVAIWASRLKSTVPITIRAGWADLAGGTLGYSGGGTTHSDFSGAPIPNTWYIASLANSLAGNDLDTSNYDMHITYNKNFAWYFGTDGNPPSGEYDFMSVVLHEIGHGLNFSGTMDYDNGNGSWGELDDPNIYDTFMEDDAGVLLLNKSVYPNPSTALGSALTSGSVWFNGAHAVAANGGARVRIYAPATWVPGSSYSHLDYTTFSGTANRLMVYAISSGSSIHDPGPVTEGMFKDMGWIFYDKQNPVNFIVDAVDKFSVGLSWEKNVNGDAVMVAWSTNSNFGIPYGTYNIGDYIAGGGTVLYNGFLTNALHLGLDMGEKYFYKAWSVFASGSYSDGVITSAVTQSILFEDFENGGVIPSGWSQLYENGNVSWLYQDGGQNGFPASAHSGSYNAFLYDETQEDDKTKLITPEIDFGGITNNTKLTFWHFMENWESDQDELRVFYKTSVSESWNLLTTYQLDVNVWTERVITLPNPNSTYYVAFEGNAKYGYGVCIDDIKITGEQVQLATYTIDANSTGEGIISPSNIVSVVAGASTSFMLTATERRHIASIKTNGINIAGSPYNDNSFMATNYVLSNIVTDVTFSVDFKVDYIDVEITDIRQSGSDIIIEWASSNGWQYICESAETLVDNPITWISVGSGWVSASGVVMTATDTNSQLQKLYHVKARP